MQTQQPIIETTLAPPVNGAAPQQTTQTVPTRDLIGSEIFYILPGGYSEGQRRPGTIVKDWGNNKVNIVVDTDAINDFPAGTPGGDGKLWVTSVDYAPATTKEPGSWHWRTESFS